MSNTRKSSRNQPVLSANLPDSTMSGKVDNINTGPFTVAEIKELARKRLSKPVWDYYICGAEQEQSRDRNESIFKEIVIRPRVLRDVSNVDTSTRIFGKLYDFPIAIAPTAYQKLVGNGGEIDVYRASKKLGLNYTLSSNSTTSMEDVIQSYKLEDNRRAQPWFQLYFHGDREAATQLISRAESAGYEALVLTVDSPVIGNRLHERHAPLQLPAGIKRANISSKEIKGASPARLILNTRTAEEAKRLAQEHRGSLVDPSLVWEETIPWLRERTKMKILVKGIMTHEDASCAIEAGVDGIVVSNHGGRQLDGVSSTLEALPEVVEAVQGKVPVIFDGGISRGSDVFKALALGADLCLIGRSALWGLAFDGQEGVETVLHILERELSRVMALAGARSIGGIERGMLGRPRKDGFGIARL